MTYSSGAPVCCCSCTEWHNSPSRRLAASLEVSSCWCRIHDTIWNTSAWGCCCCISWSISGSRQSVSVGYRRPHRWLNCTGTTCVEKTGEFLDRMSSQCPGICLSLRSWCPPQLPKNICCGSAARIASLIYVLLLYDLFSVFNSIVESLFLKFVKQCSAGGTSNQPASILITLKMKLQKITKPQQPNQTKTPHLHKTINSSDQKCNPTFPVLGLSRATWNHAPNQTGARKSTINLR